MELPSLRHVLSKVLRGLEGNEVCIKSDVSNPPLVIDSLPQSVQIALLALHQMYPQTLLTSLNLLDNGLVTRYTVPQDSMDLSNTHSRVYYVRSTQSRSSRFAAQTPRAVYEVRPEAWHCTCPSFAFSAFSSSSTFNPFECSVDDYAGAGLWGGEMRGGEVVLCKHLLAVLIGERLQLIPKKGADVFTLASYAYGHA